MRYLTADNYFHLRDTNKGTRYKKVSIIISKIKDPVQSHIHLPKPIENYIHQANP